MSDDRNWWEPPPEPAPHDQLGDPLVPAAESQRILAEQAKLAETLRALGETIAGHKAYLISQGFSAESAEGLAVQLHALISVRWFGIYG
jgi:hypothetical protein